MSRPLLDLDSIGGGTDPLSILTENFTDTHGRRLDRVQMKAIVWLAFNGSPGLARAILSAKRYQGDPREAMEMVKQVSVNQAAKADLEARAEIMRRGD